MVEVKPNVEIKPKHTRTRSKSPVWTAGGKHPERHSKQNVKQNLAVRKAGENKTKQNGRHMQQNKKRSETKQAVQGTVQPTV